MNNEYKPTVLFFLLFFNFCSHAQQIVQTPKDAYIVCLKDDVFIGKPLKYLLKEIKPPIKMVFAREGWAEQAPFFSFFFVSWKEFNKQRSEGKVPLRITVYLNETFKWQKESKDLNWLKEDEEKYGNLTIAAIRVSGVYDDCDAEPNKVH